MTVDRRIRHGVAVVLSVVGTGLIGCSDGGPATHAVSGQIVPTGGKPDQLVGHLVEIVSTTDPTVRSSGVIEANGRFRLETLDHGKVHSGARAGTYQVRLLLVDEGDGVTKKPKVPRRYQDAKTSGWSIQVPADGDVKLNLTAN